MPDEVKKAKKKMDRARMKVILRDAGQIIWGSRRRLLIGLPLLMVNRLSSIVLPGTTKFVIDDAIGKGRLDLLWKLAALAALAAALGSITDYALAQILGMAGCGAKSRQPLLAALVGRCVDQRRDEARGVKERPHANERVARERARAAALVQGDVAAAPDEQHQRGGPAPSRRPGVRRRLTRQGVARRAAAMRRDRHEFPAAHRR